MYGGLGCEKGLTWARMNLETLDWQLPQIQNSEKQIFTCNHLLIKIPHKPQYMVIPW